jgi:drug/metabolite transporter (DMT)-like permease
LRAGAVVDHRRHPVPEALLPAVRSAHRHRDPVRRSTVAALLPFAILVRTVGPALSNGSSGRRRFVGALLWSVFALSIGAIFLLFALIRRSATQVTSLLYLTPPTTAIMAWLMFGETLQPLGMLAGMVVAVAGVCSSSKKKEKP